jgi:D-glycero-D-manno-heptose 1,7-bisphosphate phosphatase
VGDSLRDLQAGEAVAADLWLVKTGKGPRTLQAAEADAKHQLPQGTRIAENLSDAVDRILALAARTAD